MAQDHASKLTRVDGASIDILDLGDHDGDAKCGCPFAVTSQRSGELIFEGLDCAEAYFPMISRNDDTAFFGAPPKSIQPASEATPNHASASASDDDHEEDTERIIHDNTKVSANDAHGDNAGQSREVKAKMDEDDIEVKVLPTEEDIKGDRESNVSRQSYFQGRNS